MTVIGIEAYARAQKYHDRRTSDQLQRAILHIGERLIRIAPHHNVFEETLDCATLAYLALTLYPPPCIPNTHSTIIVNRCRAVR